MTTQNSKSNSTQTEITFGISPNKKALQRFRRHQLAMLGVVLFSIISILSFFAPVFDRYEPNKLNLKDKFQGPSIEHFFGTDRVGRDIWSRTLHGGRISLLVGFAAASVALLIGVVLGGLSGYYGGLVDMLIMRFTDVVMTFPRVVIMLTVATFIGQGVLNVILLIGLFSWSETARLVRGQVLTIREQEHVMAARSLGAKDYRIITKHVLPSVIAPLLASITFAINNAILLEAGLSFLGVGVPLPTSSWGNMIEVARSLDVLQGAPWMWIPPALMILVNVLAINFIGDGLRDALDPKHII